jgi:hypothetical protein
MLSESAVSQALARNGCEAMEVGFNLDGMQRLSLKVAIGENNTKLQVANPDIRLLRRLSRRRIRRAKEKNKSYGQRMPRQSAFICPPLRPTKTGGNVLRSHMCAGASFSSFSEFLPKKHSAQ